MGDAQNVYKFIEECLKVIRKEGPLPADFTKKPDLDDIKTFDPAASLLPASFATVKIDDITTKEALKELLPIIGYVASTDVNIFIKKFDDGKIPPTAAKPASGYWVINIETGNAWTIDKYTQLDPAAPLYGGKKRKTNRRKHRRSNRKTLGRKK
jgi:hypothetical protein